MRPEPLRYVEARKFLEAARDMGDAIMVAVAIRVWNATNFPRTQPCTAADLATFADWKNAA